MSKTKHIAFEFIHFSQYAQIIEILLKNVKATLCLRKKLVAD